MQYHGQTIAEICEQTGQKEDTVRKRAERKLPEISYSRLYRPSEDEMEILFPSDRKRRSSVRIMPVSSLPAPRRRSTPKSIQKEVSPAKSETEQKKPSLGVDFIWWLKAIIYGHSLLVVWDLWALYKQPGIIAALIAVIFKHAAVILAGSSLNRTSMNALIACFVIDALCAWIHYLAFRLSIDRLESLSENVALWTSAVLAGFVVSASFYSLFLIRDAKPDPA